ncbi:hypothetical protein RHS01_07464 [Rhizoctonia solani]|uniref:CCHC-type domain-containing protein n=1 Tax=Rhizoctonia solani TaxID=456999 RepID=A0A8H7IBH2_9AGAM|nr:hypothetical protein RHS01_07464 [Rhizoctonia solani]
MEPEPSIGALLEAIQALSTQVGSLQDQIKSQGEQITQLAALCKKPTTLLETRLRRNPSQAWPSDGLPLLLPTQEEKPTLQARLAWTQGPVQAIQGTGFDSEEEEEPRRIKKEPQGTPARHLGSLTPFDAGSSVKRPKMDLPNPTREILGGVKPLSGSLCRPRRKKAAARKIAALTQTTTTSEYVTEFRNLMAELDWEAYIAQFTRGLHWKVKELLSTKDNIPDNDLEAIFAASIKIDNIRRENEENRPKKAPAKSPPPATTSTTTTQRVRLSEDPNYVTPEERDRRRASGLCVKCGQKGHGIKQCPNGWKASVKEVAKIAEDVESGKD